MPSLSGPHPTCSIAENLSTPPVDCGNFCVDNRVRPGPTKPAVEKLIFVHTPLWIGNPCSHWACGSFPHKILLLLLLLKRILSFF